MSNSVVSGLDHLLTPFGPEIDSFDLFISYKVENALIARRVADKIIAAGLIPWFDEYQTIFTKDLDEAIKSGIEKSKYCLVLTDELYYLSEKCRYELERILDTHSPEKILHVKLEKCKENDTLLESLKNCPHIDNPTQIDEIISFIESKTNAKNLYINNESYNFKDYMGRCMGIPYSLNIFGWHIVSNNKEIIFKKAFRLLNIFRKSSESQADYEKGPQLSRYINNHKILMNLLAGPEIEPLFFKNKILGSIDDRRAQRALKDFAIKYFSTIDGNCVGVHLVPQGGSLHYAFTYIAFSRYWSRKYSIQLPRTNSGDLVEFVFTFTFLGPFAEFCRASEWMDQLVLSFQWPPNPVMKFKDPNKISSFLEISFGDRPQTQMLMNRAFYYVEQRDYKMAMILLKKILEVDPGCGDAYNELAIMFGRRYKDLNLAEEYAHHAIECQPSNPKFHNSLISIKFQKIQKMKSQFEIQKEAAPLLVSLEEMINQSPNYPCFYLTKASALALCGQSKDEWKEQLIRAQAAYFSSGKDCEGHHIIPINVQKILKCIEAECISLNNYWMSLP